MISYEQLFTLVKHRTACSELLAYPISDAINELQDEFPLLNLHGFTEVVIENRYPVLRHTISNAQNICAVYVLFDSIYSKYAITTKAPNGFGGTTAAETCEQAKEKIKEAFRKNLNSW